MKFIPDIAEEHLEELAFLWGQRRNALRSPAYTPRELGMLDERIDAHVDGLLVLEEALPEFVAPALDGEEELPAFAAAFALLRLGGGTAVARVTDALTGARGPRLGGVCEALRHAPAEPLLPTLTLLAAGDGETAAAATEVLAFRRAALPTTERLVRLTRSESPAARASAWRAAAYSGIPLPSASYDGALRDDAPGVRQAALAAAVWGAHPGLVPYCRAVAERPSKDALDALVLLAAVAGPDELSRIASLLGATDCGPQRFRIAGTFGHPALVQPMLKAMHDADPAVAANAGLAFEKLAGVSVESGRRATVAPAGPPPDEVEAEFLEEVMLPDPDAARKHWESIAPRVSNATRVCRGHDVSRAMDRTVFAALDMESRWEFCARARYAGQWQGTAALLEAFPMRA